MTDANDERARLVGINHVALEVDDVEAALEFYSELFEVELRGQTESAIFIDMGDQFLAISEGREQADDEHRHFGLVVDDREPVRRRLEAIDEAEVIPSSGLDFRDPWGNYVQVVEYRDIQFTKADHVLEGMEMSDLEKTEEAIDQLRKKGLLGE